MPKSPQELGSKSPFKLRVGIDIPTWKGINLEGDPGAISPDEFQDAINVRILPSGALVCRGGQEKVNQTPFDGCVMGIFDDEVPASTLGKWWFGSGFSFDAESDVIDRGVTDEQWLVSAIVNGVLLVLSADKKLYSWNTDTEARTLVHDFATTDAVGANMVAVGSILYVCFLNPDVATASVWTWNGTTATLDHTFTGVGFKPFLASYNGEAYLTFAGTNTPASGLGDPPNQVWRRLAGTWTSLGMPSVYHFGCFDWIVYAGSLYLCGYTYPGFDATSCAGVILKYDGATLTKVREIGDPNGSNNVVTAMAIQSDTLCYLNVNLNTPGLGQTTLYIGTFDGSTWNDTAKNMSAQFGTTGTDDVSYGSIAFVTDDNMYIISEFDVIDFAFFAAAVRLFKSPNGTVVGDWTSVGEVTGPHNQAKAYI